MDKETEHDRVHIIYGMKKRRDRGDKRGMIH